MATFKKLFVSLLTSLVLVSCIGFNIFAVVDTYHKSSDKKYTLPVTGIN